jgi:hypothetical protein
MSTDGTSGVRKSAHVLNKPIGSSYFKYAGTRGRFYYYICWLAQVTSRKYALKQGNRIGVDFIKYDIQGCLFKI